MATYLELHGLINDSDLQTRVETGLIVGMQTILDAPSPTVEQQKYSAQVFANPRGEGRKALASVLAKNKDVTVQQIQAAPDTGANSIQENVDLVIPTLVVAFNAANP